MNQQNTTPPLEQSERYITAAEVGEHYGVTGRHILNLASRKIIPSIRLGKSRRFRLRDIAAALEKCANSAASGESENEQSISGVTDLNSDHNHTEL